MNNTGVLTDCSNMFLLCMNHCIFAFYAVTANNACGRAVHAKLRSHCQAAVSVLCIYYMSVLFTLSNASLCNIAAYFLQVFMQILTLEKY